MPSIRSPSNQTSPRVRRHRPADQVEHRRLARAVGPDQRGDRALGDLERRAVDRAQAAEALRQALDLEQRAPARAPARSGIARALAQLQPGADQPGLAARAHAPRCRSRSVGMIPRGRKMHDQRHQPAEDQQARVAAAEVVVRPLVQRLDQERAEHRPEQRAAAAEQHRQQDLDAEQDVEHPDRVDEREVVAVDRAGHADEHRAGDEAEQLVDRRVDADRRGLVLVLAHRDQAHAELRPADPPAHQQRERRAAPASE